MVQLRCDTFMFLVVVKFDVLTTFCLSPESELPNESSAVPLSINYSISNKYNVNFSFYSKLFFTLKEGGCLISLIVGAWKEIWVLFHSNSYC